MSTSKTKIVSKVRETLLLTSAERAEWVKCYQATGKLPDINIPCSKCQLGITATHGNLASKVTRYGGIVKLLENFVCKCCTPGSDVPKIIKTRKPRAKKKQIDSVIHKDEHGRYNIPYVNLNPERTSYSILDISKNSELTKEFTNNTCLMPHVYLDNDNTCDHCPLFDNCAVGFKQLSRAKRKLLALI